MTLLSPCATVTSSEDVIDTVAELIADHSANGRLANFCSCNGSDGCTSSYSACPCKGRCDRIFDMLVEKFPNSAPDETAISEKAACVSSAGTYGDYGDCCYGDCFKSFHETNPSTFLVVLI
ncbi:MAG: hypothetical protein KDJ69_05985 [Nitratireductor sp.]|nr:hypothetical protein [Nitratireductor sp.]